MQRRASVLAGAIMVGLFAGPSARAVQASETDKLTYVTFSGPVEVPGVGLSAGTYIFKLADPETSRVIQILSKDGKTIYASFFSRPDPRWSPADGTIVTFHDGLAGAPQAIKTWFLLGETTGFEFVYPPEQALRIASAAASFVKESSSVAVR
jgi:hypothetical protein